MSPPPSPPPVAGGPEASGRYGERYFAERVGDEPYHRGNPVWHALFGRIADAVVAELAPKTVLDAGCAIGFLVEALRDRGVEAYGIDVSEYAISQAPPEVRRHCRVASVTDELERDYDLIVCIEVLEHLPPEQADAAVANLARHAEAVLFSSTPDDFTEPTHLNVRPTEYWVGLFGRHGFFRDLGFDAAFVAPQAVLLRRTRATAPTVARDYEREYWRLSREVRALREEILALTERLDRARREPEPVEFVPRRPRYLRLVNRLEPVRALAAPPGSARYRALRRLVLSLPGGSRVTRSLRPLSLNEQYWLWLEENALTDERLRELRREAAALGYRPLVSVVMPVRDTPAALLAETVESVRAQVYDDWELCVADDASSRRETLAYLDGLASDSRVKLTRLEQRGGIAAASNAALALAGGEFVALLDHDDELKPDALYRVVRLLNERPELDYVYSDRDKKDPEGRLIDPFFKPDWSPDLELSINYVTHLGVYRRSVLEHLGGFRPGYDGSQDYDLALRVTEATDRIAHVARPLYTWRMAPGSAATSTEAKPYAYAAAKRALADALARRGVDADVLDGAGLGAYRVRYRVARPPSVAVVTSASVAASYPALTVVRVRPCASPADVNAAARSAGAELLVFLEDGVEPVDDGWLEGLVEHAQRAEVGVVGARVLGAVGAPSEEGVVVGLGGSARAVDYREAGLSEVVRNCSAVTGCLATRADVFDALGGFDDAFRRSFGGVDLCLRARAEGLWVVYTPYAVLRRGRPPEPPEAADEETFRRRWLPMRDPFYNPNFSLTRPFKLRLAADGEV